MAERIVIDASAMVDFLVDSPLAAAIGERIHGCEVHVPAHFDAEVLSALGRLHRAQALTEVEVEERVELTTEAPFRRHLLAPFLRDAWGLHHNVRTVDAIYIALADHLESTIITTDSGKASAAGDVAELVET